MKLDIEQLPDEDITIIEGTRYANVILRTLGQRWEWNGPFLIVKRENGELHMRTITKWPE